MYEELLQMPWECSLVSFAVHLYFYQQLGFLYVYTSSLLEVFRINPTHLGASMLLARLVLRSGSSIIQKA